MDLLKSEYPVIQQMALNAMQLATQEGERPMGVLWVGVCVRACVRGCVGYEVVYAFTCTLLKKYH